MDENLRMALQLAATLLGAGILSVVVIPPLRRLGLPDKSVPPVAHGLAIATTILLSLIGDVLTSNGITWSQALLVVLTGISGALMASGYHGQWKGLTQPSPEPALATTERLYPTTGTGVPPSAPQV